MLPPFQAAALPVGLVEVTALPPPTATQRLLLGQETPVRPYGEPSVWVFVQVASPPLGLLEVTTPPASSTATQRPLLGQETPVKYVE